MRGSCEGFTNISPRKVSTIFIKLFVWFLGGSGKIFISIRSKFSAYSSTQEESCHRFRRGLRDSLRHPLVSFYIQDFFELVESMKMVENDLVSTH
ncbi:hypothetical protein IEQ34_003771 [Dendrobium chrysotoxum]|uniref:Uncharacterized protein n=1 Tax=Dendrobium chrysotoxum TaxID=161865 RepID=A0AAV7HGD5_DENCH|nr:hypothetical protein IEQ34_003771 [Dendrobium chrysotoxum]